MKDYSTEGLDLALHIRRTVLGQASALDVPSLEMLCLRQAQLAARGTRDGAVDHESELQALLVAALRSDALAFPTPYREEQWGVVAVHHSPLGGARSEREGAELKRNGARAGWPDLDLRCVDLFGRRRSPVLELKAPGGRLSKVQKETRDRLLAGGFEAYVAVGLVEMVDRVTEILRGGSFEASETKDAAR